MPASQVESINQQEFSGTTQCLRVHLRGDRRERAWPYSVLTVRSTDMVICPCFLDEKTVTQRDQVTGPRHTNHQGRETEFTPGNLAQNPSSYTTAYNFPCNPTFSVTDRAGWAKGKTQAGTLGSRARRLWATVTGICVLILRSHNYCSLWWWTLHVDEDRIFWSGGLRSCVCVWVCK